MSPDLAPAAPSGAPVAVPREGCEKSAPSRTEGYHQLDEGTFEVLLDEVGPRGLATTVVLLLAVSTASTVLLGTLAYGLGLLPAAIVLSLLGAATLATFEAEKRRRRRRVVDAGLALGLSEGFAERLARDLEGMKSWVPEEDRPGALASWPTERAALVQALGQVRRGDG